MNNKKRPVKPMEYAHGIRPMPTKMLADAVAAPDPLYPCEGAMFSNPVVSFTECTRITPTPPLSLAEAQSEEDIFPVPVTTAKTLMDMIDRSERL